MLRFNRNQIQDQLKLSLLLVKGWTSLLPEVSFNLVFSLCHLDDRSEENSINIIQWSCLSLKHLQLGLNNDLLAIWTTPTACQQYMVLLMLQRSSVLNHCPPPEHRVNIAVTNFNIVVVFLILTLNLETLHQNEKPLWAKVKSGVCPVKFRAAL